MDERTIGLIGGALLIVSVIVFVNGATRFYLAGHPDSAWAQAFVKLT